MLFALTIAHVVISLVGIVSGFVVLAGLLSSRRLDTWTAVFLTSTVATSVTGFLFPFEQLLPSHVIGFISLPLLTAAIVARYFRNLVGVWRPVYVITALFSLYLNFFVLIAQTFQKVPALHALAPTQSEAPFLLVQVAALIAFLALGFRAVTRFRTEPFSAPDTGLVSN